MAPPTALTCAVCAQRASLSTDEPTASAEVATFIAAHAHDDRLAIELVIPPLLVGGH